MKKQDILYSTLLAFILTLNPLSASTLKLSTQNQTNSLTLNIAKILHNRGLDDDAAHEISENFFLDNEEDFSMMLTNIENGCSIINRDELIEYLSSLILQRRDVDLSSYEFLVGMVHNIKKRALNSETLQELKNISSKNFIYSQHIA